MIKGVEWYSERRLEQEVEEFLERRLGRRMRVRSARKVWARDSVYGMVVELGSRGEKEEVLGRRKELGKGVYVQG